MQQLESGFNPLNATARFIEHSLHQGPVVSGQHSSPSHPISLLPSVSAINQDNNACPKRFKFLRPSNNSRKALPPSSAIQTASKQSRKRPQRPPSTSASTSTHAARKPKKAKVTQKQEGG
ncbi:hypothetical protein PGTUg99_019946 [Puccinia graminis f. sp. tritici]|uniref:Uncharacterized protein n=1 Tax=Puccinia graminis f. sp. tritici TaxID=56615 RepID=A0A5B0P632_PUCGR|nr:hypothetical protein PGTUg99_019946 [Puccinia graminis f. sp. tritici]